MWPPLWTYKEEHKLPTNLLPLISQLGHKDKQVLCTLICWQLGPVCYSSSDFTLTNVPGIPYNIYMPRLGARVLCQIEAVPMPPTQGFLASLIYWKTNEPFFLKAVSVSLACQGHAQEASSVCLRLRAEHESHHYIILCCCWARFPEAEWSICSLVAPHP